MLFILLIEPASHFGAFVLEDFDERGVGIGFMLIVLLDLVF